jgi:hypothetical protein
MRMEPMAVSLLVLGIVAVPLAEGVTADPSDFLVVDVATDDTVYDCGEPVHVWITVTNTASTDITVYFPSSQLADYYVMGPGLYYLWSHGMFFLTVVTPLDVAAGETKTILYDVWNQRDIMGNPASPGTHYLRGWMVGCWWNEVFHPDVYGDYVIIEILDTRPRFIRGDLNGDTAVLMSDVVYLMRHLYVPGSPEAVCFDAADANDDGQITYADASHLLRYLYSVGVEPSAPFPDCGPDPTTDGLGCAVHPCNDRR